MPVCCEFVRPYAAQVNYTIVSHTLYIIGHVLDVLLIEGKQLPLNLALCQPTVT